MSQVLMLSKPGAENSQVWVGKPYVAQANVGAEVVGQGRGEKVLIIKMKKRKGYRKTQGHRQELTQLIVTSVDNGAGEKATLSAEDKKKRLDQYTTSLTPKGPARSQKILGSRKRMAQAKAAPQNTAAKK